MRIALVSPGSLYSTTDVYQGLADGLDTAGADVFLYDSLKEIYMARLMWEHVVRESGDVETIPRWGMTPWELLALPSEQQQAYRDFDEMVRRRGFLPLVYQCLVDRVQAVLFVSGYLPPDELLQALSRRHGGPFFTGIIYTESPYEDKRQLRQAHLIDAAWVNELSSLEAFRHVVPTAYFPMAYHPKKHYPMSVQPEYDVVFVGVGYPERIALLEGVDWTGIRLGLFGDWRNVAEDSPLRPFVHQGIISNDQATALYRSARIGLNMFRTCVDYWNKGDQQATTGQSLNPRSYELAACKVAQVTEWRPEVDARFGSYWRNICTFTTSEELQDRIRLLLDKPVLRDEVAVAQMVAVQGHSYYNRAVSLLGQLEHVLAPPVSQEKE